MNSEAHGMNLLAGEIADLRDEVRTLKTEKAALEARLNAVIEDSAIAEYGRLALREALMKIKALADELNTLEGLGIVGMKQVSEMAAIAMSNNEQH